jgi:hypothetical protein
MALSYDIADRSGRGRIDPTCAGVRIVPHAWTLSAHARAKCEASNIEHAISESNRARTRAALARGGGDDLLAFGHSFVGGPGAAGAGFRMAFVIMNTQRAMITKSTMFPRNAP